MRGRPPLGAEIVAHLEGSAPAKRRLAVILRTLAGQLTIPQACGELGIGESRFHDLRNEVLQHALANLEPKPVGRPSPRPSEAEAQLADQQRETQQLQADLRAAQIRQELALTLPRLAHPPAESGEKKRRSRRRRSGR